MKELKKALTFDDILLVPAHSEVLPKEVDLTSKLTNLITLNTPIISAASTPRDHSVSWRSCLGSL